MKRLLLAAILFIPTMGLTNIASAHAPFPGCYPCPPQPPDPPAVQTEILPADAR